MTAVIPTPITEAVKRVFDLRPGAIIRDLDLRRPIYEKIIWLVQFILAIGEVKKISSISLIPIL